MARNGALARLASKIALASAARLNPRSTGLISAPLYPLESRYYSAGRVFKATVARGHTCSRD